MSSKYCTSNSRHYVPQNHNMSFIKIVIYNFSNTFFQALLTCTRDLQKNEKQNAWDCTFTLTNYKFVSAFTRLAYKTVDLLSYKDNLRTLYAYLHQ